MLSRSLMLAACFALAAGKTFNMECGSASPQCKKTCCGYEWKLGGAEGDYTCSKQGEPTCGLCGQMGMNECEFPFEDGLAPKYLDASGNPLPTAAPGGLIIGSSVGKLGTTTPNSVTTSTVGSYNGMKGWLDIEASTFQGFADFLLGIPASIPSMALSAGHRVDFRCQSSNPTIGPNFDACDLFFFIYHCPPCKSMQGGLPEELSASAEPVWYPGNCGPTFSFNRKLGTVDHRFQVWQAEVKRGEQVTVKMPGNVQFMFTGLVAKSVYCSDLTTESDCLTELDSCRWSEGVCRPQGCPPPVKGFQGANLPKCAVCVDDEEDFIPEVIW